MSNFHIVSGMPRAGSTLLCNLLNQRDDTYASSTSALSQIVSSMLALFTDSPEEKSRLENIPGTAELHRKLIRDYCLAFHGVDDEYVFDKGRAWTHGITQIRDFSPDTKMLICVRDPRNVIASIERQHQKNAIYGQGDLATRVQNQISPTGLVGAPMTGITDILNRPSVSSSVYYVMFERFVMDPRSVMRDIDSFLEMEAFEYDVDNVQNSATDLDVLYGYQFPHEGTGKVVAPTYDWREYLSPEAAEFVLTRFPLIASRFGYE